MMIPEKESGNYWCPFGVGRSPTGGTSANRSSSDQPITMCLGKRCMAWNWGHLTESDEEGCLSAEEVDAPPTLDPSKTYKPRKGYCGLSQKPR